MPAKGATTTSASSQTTVTRFAKFKSSLVHLLKFGPATKTKHDFVRRGNATHELNREESDD